MEMALNGKGKTEGGEVGKGGHNHGVVGGFKFKMCLDTQVGVLSRLLKTPVCRWKGAWELIKFESLLRPEDQQRSVLEKGQALALSTIKSKWWTGTSHGDLERMSSEVEGESELLSKRKFLITLRSEVGWCWGRKLDWRDFRQKGDSQSGCYVCFPDSPSLLLTTNNKLSTKHKNNYLRIFEESTTEGRLWNRDQVSFSLKIFFSQYFAPGAGPSGLSVHFRWLKLQLKLLSLSGQRNQERESLWTGKREKVLVALGCLGGRGTDRSD